MAYKTLYRVFRPVGFDEVYGQQHITDILKKQVEGGKASHAYLFYGPRGTGKTSTAKIFANALNCLNPQNGNPCGVCEVCKSFQNDAFVDIVEIDAASNNGVDNVRDIREKVSLLPVQGKYKVYIIDEVHMLSTGAFNALLKTLEEPPAHAVFILATTELRKVPATIVSRCQKYDFKRITIEDIIARLQYVAEKTNVAYEPEALELIARQAEGAMRDALSIMDQCIGGGGGLTYGAVQDAIGIADDAVMAELTQAVLGEDAVGALDVLNKLLGDGISAHNLLRDLIAALSNELAANARDAYQCANILRSLEALIGAQGTIRYSSVPNAVLTAVVVRATVNTVDVDTEDIELRLKKLEQRVERMAAGQTPARQAASPAKAEKPAAEPPPREEPARRIQPDATESKPAAPERPKARPAATGGADKLQELKDEVLHRNMALYPSANTIRKMELQGNRLVAHVAEEDLPLAEMLASETHNGEMAEIFEHVFGQRMTLDFVRIADGEKQAQDDVQQELIDLFGEDNVDIIE